MNKQSIGEMLRKIDARPDELESFRGKWVNIYLHTNGSFTGGTHFDTPEQANDWAVAYLEKHKIFRIHDAGKFICLNTQVYLHLPMPVGNP